MMASTPPTIGGAVKCSRPTLSERAPLTAARVFLRPVPRPPLGEPDRAARAPPGASRARPGAARVARCQLLPDPAGAPPGDPDSALPPPALGPLQPSNMAERS